MTPKELENDVEDLKAALRHIGRIVVDDSLKPIQRIDRVLGILSIWECEPPKNGSKS